jgi:hypothetical protein
VVTLHKEASVVTQDNMTRISTNSYVKEDVEYIREELSRCDIAQKYLVDSEEFSEIII